LLLTSGLFVPLCIHVWMYNSAQKATPKRTHVKCVLSDSTTLRGKFVELLSCCFNHIDSDPCSYTLKYWYTQIHYRSQWIASTQQQQSGTLPPPNGFCHSCPLAGADCPGGSIVEAQDGWWKIAEELGVRRRADSGTSNIQVFRVYQCPLEACSTNNTCKVCCNTLGCIVCAATLFATQSFAIYGGRANHIHHNA